MKTILKLFIPLFFLFLSSVVFAQDSTRFEQPVLISSAGQSADVKLAEILFKKQKIEQRTINIAKISDLEGVKTLVLVPGFSSKGLGAAGISADDEIVRVKNLIKAAHEKNIPVVLLHIGGKARRKGQSDKFITETAKAAKYMIVVEQGNEDGFFTKLAEQAKTPLVIVDKIPNCIEPIGKIFRKL